LVDNNFKNYTGYVNSQSKPEGVGMDHSDGWNRYGEFSEGQWHGIAKLEH